jgi:hypothetical protein
VPRSRCGYPSAPAPVRFELAQRPRGWLHCPLSTRACVREARRHDLRTLDRPRLRRHEQACQSSVPQRPKATANRRAEITSPGVSLCRIQCRSSRGEIPAAGLASRYPRGGWRIAVPLSRRRPSAIDAASALGTVQGSSLRFDRASRGLRALTVPRRRALRGYYVMSGILDALFAIMRSRF